MTGVPSSARASFAAAAAVAALASLLPFTRGLLSGGALYFRDLSLLFHPFRRYAAEGVRAGELRFWDPFVHEGVPLLYLPVSYPFDLLQALWLDERWFSLLLVLHVPLAAVMFVLLARGLGLGPFAAAGGAIVHALGGFTLSTVNLYVYVQAIAWAPLVVLALVRSAGRSGRAIVLGALAVAVAFSTTGVEVALQAVAVGLALTASVRRPRQVLGPLAAVAIGAGLAAPQFLVMWANMAAGERAHGFAVDVVLNQSVHPFALLQVVVGNLFGDLGRLPERWWGSNFFERGFPYILSVYLGATTLALAVTGAVTAWPRTRRLIVLGAAALLVCLGRWGGLEILLELVPAPWRVFRYPVKAFFTVQLVVALLLGFGLDALVRGGAVWRRLVWLSGVFGALLVGVQAIPLVWSAGTRWFVGQFFPPALSWPTRLGYFDAIVRDAAGGGALALVAALVALLAARGRLRDHVGSLLVLALAAGDLLRTGGGLNPMVEASFFRVSSEVVSALREAPGLQRVFTCEIEESRAYWDARLRTPERHELMTFAAQTDTLTPHLNRRVSIPSALGRDLTALVPRSRLLPEGVGCADPAALVPVLRGAGVSHVLSLDPLHDAALAPVAELTPARIAPLRVHLYSIREPVPLRFVARRVRRGAQPPASGPSPDEVWLENAPEEVDGAQGTVRSVAESPQRVGLEADVTRATAVVVLDGAFPGWSAAVNGRPTELRAAGHHRAVWVGPGRSLITMRYEPPGLRAGLIASSAAAALMAGLWTRGGEPLA